jgi:hypothetical protein
MLRLVFFLLTAGFAVGPGHSAETPREIDWEALAPIMPEIEDPFTHLHPDQRLDLFAISGIRAQAESGATSKVSPTYEMGVELTHKLKSAGLDVEALLAKLREIEEEIARQDSMTVPELEGQLVKMPGYALPLEFAGKGVTEFLLVPYLGACIHTPPPPPNQMVFVRLENAFTLEDIYTPVIITGRLKIAGTTKTLSYVDGETDVASGYTLDATAIEIYRQ